MAAADPRPPSFLPRLRDEEDGTEVPLTGRIVTFGSARECALRLSGKGVPERLGHFLYRAGGYTVQALSPDGPVRLNGRPVPAAAPLRHGDRLELGPRRFAYLEGGSDPVGIPQDTRDAEAAAAPLGGVISALVRLLEGRDADVFAALTVSVSGLLRCDAARVVEEPGGDGERRTLARFPERSGLERFSNRAIEWARGAPGSVLAREEDWDGEGREDSLRRNAVGSVLCTALREGDAIVGYLYLDRTRDSAPFDAADRALCDALRPLFELVLARRRESDRQRATIARLQSAGLEEKGGLVWSGPAMAKAVELARRAARTDATVLIHGETGTGKELLARFIHSHSSRAAGPFIALNCGAIPGNLVESELFGHEKGAFTGADARKAGLFEAAHGGTLFLDEIGELPAAVQVKLLRVLQEGEVRRIGGSENVAVDARILAATHRDLAQEVQEGRFRQDLFFRLSVLGVDLPSLRERGEDVLLLAEFLLKKHALRFGLPEKALSRAAREKLARHSWPGNVRELENAIQKALLMSDHAEIGAEDVDVEVEPAPPPPAAGGEGGASGHATLRAARTAAERKAISEALAATGGNVSAAAKRLEVDRKWLMKLMEDYGLDAGSFRT